VIRAGVIHNPTSRRNREAGARRADPPGVLTAATRSPDALDGALAAFAAKGLDLLVIDGGDGTVREVMTRAPSHFGDRLPRFAVLPSGKTNALALDLGAPMDWSLEQAIAAAEDGRFTQRAPLEITRQGAAAPFVRGFILGAGAYVRATELAQRAHHLGLFNNLAVALTLGGAALGALAGGPRSPWRRGSLMRLAEPERGHEPVFLLFASTLKRLPMGLKPLGEPSAELRLLTVTAPPRQLARALPPILSGRFPPWLEAAGYQRQVTSAFDLGLDDRFVLDGETYSGGELRVARGAELGFVKP